MQKNTKKNQTSLKWWLGSYSIIIALAILINLLGYSVAIRIVEAEVEKANMLTLSNIKSIYDMYFSNIEDTSYQVLSSTTVKQLENRREVGIDMKTELIKTVSGRIGSMLAENIISEVLVVIKNKDMCIDSQNMYDLKTAYSINFKDSYQSYDAWLNDLQDVQVCEYRFLRKNDGSTGMYLIRTQAELHKPTDSYIIVIFNVNAIETMLGKSLASGEGSFYMTQEDGSVIFGTDSLFDKIDLREGHTLMRADGRNYVVSAVDSRMKGTSYVYSVSNEIYRRKINSVIIAFIGSYLLCILFGGLLAWFFSKKNYAHAMSAQRAIRERNIKLSSSILSQILLRKIKVENGNQAFLSEYHIKLSGKGFVVAAIDFQAGPGGGEDEQAMVAQETMEEIKAEITKLMEPIGEVNFCEIRDLFICIISSFDTEDVLPEISGAFTALRQMLTARYQIDFVCALSQVTDDISGLPDLYKQTEDIIKFRFIQQDKFIFGYDDIMQAGNSYQYSRETERRLIQLMNEGNEEQAIQFIEEIFHYNITVRKIDMSMLRILTSVLVNTLLKAAVELDPKGKLDYRVLCGSAVLVSNDTGFKNARKIMADFVRQLCEEQSDDKRLEKDLRIAGVEEYIAQNYSQNDLSVSKIADQFGITPNYMSHYFKEQKGEGLLDYIIKFRIGRAKQLMRETDRSVSAIAQEVGFTNSVVFTKAFKRYEGITPTQYRKLPE